MPASLLRGRVRGVLTPRPSPRRITPRHKFYAAALPKGYRVGKGICDPKNQVLVACYFLQPYFIDLAIWIRHFPKIATFLTVRGTCRSQLSHFENSWKPKPPRLPRTIFGPFFGVPVTSFVRPLG